MNYYNEFDPYAAQWLRNLIAAGEIPAGDVDDRSILDVTPADLKGYTQHHFFAGIGGWSFALRLAGWSASRPVVTGSPPCQPFSDAGLKKGFADERHLWPVYFKLVQAIAPRVVFGEQVASKDALAWLDIVSTDLENEGYTFWAGDMCAAGFGAPHIRQRLFIVAHADDKTEGGRGIQGSRKSNSKSLGSARERSSGLCADGFLAHAMQSGRAEGWTGAGDGSPAGIGGALGVVNGERQRREGCVGPGNMELQGGPGEIRPAAEAGTLDGLADAGNGQLPQPQRGPDRGNGDGSDRPDDDGSSGRPMPTNGHWGDPDWLFCRDGKWRAVEPDTFPLAHGVPGRVGRLRAYGNAIVPEEAAEVVAAFLDYEASSS